MDRKDQAITDAYTSIGWSADRIAAFHELRRQFLDNLPEDVRAEGDDCLVWRLLQLRKAGKLQAKHREN